jgi:Nuclear transport factor 2 (NTF2) domain
MPVPPFGPNPAHPPAALLAAVERSPQAAGSHDRSGWVGLFAPDGSIEDPVGSRPHRGRQQIESFYDTFIGPRDITFHRNADAIVGTTVVRDVELEVRMGSSVTMEIPAYLRYDLDGDLKIARLQAFWQLPAMVRQFAGSGLGAVPAGLQLSRALLFNQGLAGTAGFLSGFGGVGARGKRYFGGLLDEACAGDEVAIKRRLAAPTLITRGDTDRIGTSELAALMTGARWEKMIGAGRQVVARVRSDDRRFVVFGEFESHSPRLSVVRVFAADASA